MLLFITTGKWDPLILRGIIDKVTLTYQNLAILNTKQPHAVNSPSRMNCFSGIAIHDIMFGRLNL